MKGGKERDILEFYPTALYTVAMIAKSGGSLEEGLHFVATHDFGRVSLLFRQVLDIAHEDSLTKGLESLRERSDNRYFRESVIVMIQYAKFTEPIADRLVALGNRIETDAVMTRRRHYQRVENALVPQTTMLMGAVPFVLVIAYGLLTRPVFVDQEPILSRRNLDYLITAWIGIMLFVYPLLYAEYIFKNPVYRTPNLAELKRVLGTHHDAAISRFLNNTANFIEMGWSLEMAMYNAIPEQASSGIRSDEKWGRRALASMSDDSISFSGALIQVGAWANSRKFNLTLEFLELAKRSKYTSLAETLKLLADSFWKSHMTEHHYQSEIMTPVGFSIGFKMVSMFVMSLLFPFFAPFLILLFSLDLVLMIVSIL